MSRPKPLDVALEQAVDHHKAGRLPEAERLYRTILKKRPRHPEANHNLGVLATQKGTPDAGLPHLKAALQVDPGEGQYWLSYAAGLLAAGQAKDALATLEQGNRNGLSGPSFDALITQVRGRLQPDISDSDTPALYAAALKHHQAGRLDEAAALYRRLLVVQPDIAEAHNNLGSILEKQGKLDEALASYQRALAVKPEAAEVNFNLGNVLQRQSKLDEAAMAYESAIAARPGHAAAHNNLGNVLKAQNRLDEAVSSYGRAISAQPDYADAYNNLGTVLRQQGKLDEAAAYYERAIALKPNFAEACNNLGVLLEQQGKLDEAAAHYERAVVLEPNLAAAHTNLCDVYRRNRN